METRTSPDGLVESCVPARLDRLPWTSWHTWVVLALGASWVLDGLEITLAGALAAVLTRADTLALTPAEAGASASCYLLGAVLGALVFGRACDRYGRRRLFFVTVAVYLLATAASACAWDFASYALCRALTGAGIGGEYAAINSAIDELVPARHRGRVALMVNASYWLGAALGAGAASALLSTSALPADLAWRIAYGVGALLGLGVLLLRRHVPESPRWLLTHGQAAAAERIVAAAEARAGLGPADGATLPVTRLRPRGPTPWRTVWQVILVRERRRALLGVVLMAAQAFFYNAIFFTYGLVLARFYAVPDAAVGHYLLPFAAGNVLGPFVLGKYFDTVGRRPMIALTYAASGVLLAVTAALFQADLLTATTQTLAWSVVFFFASAAASSAYLTVSEIFPLELRAVAIALFFALGTLLGGVAAPALFGWIVGQGAREALTLGYVCAALLMVGAAWVALRLGVAAEGRGLEEVAPPLSNHPP